MTFFDYAWRFVALELLLFWPGIAFVVIVWWQARKPKRKPPPMPHYHSAQERYARLYEIGRYRHEQL